MTHAQFTHTKQAYSALFAVIDLVEIKIDAFLIVIASMVRDARNPSLI